MTSTPAQMQRALNICTQWAETVGLRWNTAKCTIIAAEPLQSAEFYLQGESSEFMPSAAYLGVRMQVTGVSDSSTLERIRSAMARINQLKAIGLRRPRLGIKRIAYLYSVLIQPLWTYSIHLTPLTPAIEEEFQKTSKRHNRLD